MITQSPVARVGISNVTLNFIFLLGMWGYFTEWYAKKKKWTKRKSIIFYIVATLIFFTLLKFAGMETIFG
jgi:hypothetical protein